MDSARELAMERAKERDKAAWILDFILRQQMDESVKNGIYDYLPDGADNPHFKKTMLLHWIGSHLAKHSISENTLQCLESIAKLYRKVGDEVLESLKEAYCAVAVECTSSTLRESSPTDLGNFFDAVKRIWIRRVPYLGQSEAAGLFSDRLEVMRKQMKMAVVSPAAREGVLSWDAKGEALNSLNKYLNEALNAMGPPPLELMIEAMIQEGTVCKDGSRPARESGVPAAQRPTDGASPLHLGCLGPDLNRETAGLVHGSDIPEGSTRARGFDAPWQWLMNEALKLGPAEVQMIVEDPLTNEVSMPFEVPSSMGHEAMNPTPLEPSQDINVPDLFGTPSTCNFELDDASIEAPAKESPSSSRNARLYNLREREISPLQVNESTKVGTRRKIKRWSTLEKNTLRQAVERDGRKWKFILGLYPQIFENRTEVDLKDKWRNMTEH